MRVAVAGGTGVVGRHVVAQLTAAGHEPVVLARSRGVDLITGVGLPEALVGFEGVIDVVNVTTVRRAAAERLFAAAAGHLVAAAAAAGVRHLVTLSIVGIDQVDLGYYIGKRRQEERVAAGPVPWTVLRATQFHEFAEQQLQRTPGPLVPVPAMLVQPVAASEVAAELIERVTGDAARGVVAMAGPEQLQLRDMVRQVIRATGRRRWVVPVRLPGQAGRAMATGALIPTGDYVQGRLTFSEHLAELRAG